MLSVLEYIEFIISGNENHKLNLMIYPFDDANLPCVLKDMLEHHILI